MTVERRIDEAVAAPAWRLQNMFFDPLGPFAGSTFDQLGENPPDSISHADLLAVSLLDVRFEARAVRAMLFSEAERLSALLSEIPAGTDLWEADDGHLDAADILFKALDGYPGVGETKASKLLARKRPRLFPVVDSVVRRGLELGTQPVREIRKALASSPSRLVAIESTRPENASREFISTIRLLDAAVWMRHSRSRNAIHARRAAGLQ